jgi:WD40 repeat protein
MLAIGGYDGVVEIWSSDKGGRDDEGDEEEEEFEGGEKGKERGLLKSAPTFRYCCSITGQENEIKSCTFSLDSGLLCTTSRDKTQWIWDIQGCCDGMDPEVVSIVQHGGDVKCSRWTDRGSNNAMVGGAGYDGVAKWMTEDEEGDFRVRDTLESELAGGYTSSETEEERRPGWETIWDICMSSSGARMCLGRGDGVVVVYDSVSSGWRLKGFAGTGGWDTCYSVDLPKGGSSHFNILACVGRGIKVYKETSLFESSGERSHLFKVDNEVPAGHEGEIFEGRWRRGGQGFVTIGEEGSVNIWEYEVG